MKKLLTLIGAATVAFGLFANEPVSFATSFESGEAGVEGTTFTPGEGWTWEGEPLSLGTYADDAYEYGTGDLVRRFDGENGNYLELSTGEKLLTRELGEGNTTVDQLVKFTGYDEPLTDFAADAKIAVWMLGSENDGDTPGETNLYVTCGADKTRLKLVAPAGTTWQTEKWYRLTVKSLGADATGREQFNIYIDGQLLSSVGQDTQTVFPSMAENAPVTKMKVQGIGAIDDLTIDAEGPLFTQAAKFTVELANVGGKASVTVDQEGEIEAGTKITGTITDVASGYAAYVFVDDVRVAVDQDGKFEGVANNSGKVTVAYVKDTSWIVESFVRNYFKSGITSEGCQCAAYDAQNGKAFFSCSPSAGSTDVVEYDYAALANGFGERIAEEHYAGKGTLEGAMWARSFGVANGYMISCNRGAAAPGKLQVRYYLDADGKPVKYESTSAESIQLKDAEGQDLNYTLYPVAMNKAGTNVYGSDGSKLYKFAVGVDATTKKVTSLTLVNAWRINWRPSGMTVANIGGKEIVYGKGCESEGAFGLMVVDTSLDDTEDAMVAKYLDADVGGDGEQEAFGLAVSGVAEGLPHITMIGPMQGKVFALTADGLDLAGKDPLWTVRFAEIGIKVDTNLRYGIVVPDDESRLMLGLNDGGLAVAVLERKPENLIVRGRVGEAQDDDRTIKFGAAVKETFTAPEGYEITAVTVNGTAVEDFVAADSYTYAAEALNEYVLVKMTVAEKTFTAKFIQGLNRETTNDVVVAYGDEIPLESIPALAEVAGYTAAWDSDPAGAGAITEDKTFTAVYTANTYYVTFYTNEVEAARANYTYGDASTFVAPTIEGVTAWSNETYDAEFVFNANVADNTQKAYAKISKPEGIKPGETQPLAPGPTTPEAAQEAADKIPVVLSDADKAAGLTTDVLYTKAELIGGAWQAVVEVKPEFAPEIETTAEEPISVDATDFTAKIQNAQPGLYYGFKAVDALGTDAEFEPVGTFRRAPVDGKGELTLTAPKGTGNARFFKLTVSVTDLTPKAE